MFFKFILFSKKYVVILFMIYFVIILKKKILKIVDYFSSIILKL